MSIWSHSKKDAILLGFSLVQLGLLFVLATAWEGAPIWFRGGGAVLLALMMAYNIIVVSHLFTHVPWFTSARLNAVTSALNSINIGQSVQSYHLTHVRNHHRFNNDRVNENGTTRDRSSTYRNGCNGEHTPLLRYVLTGALESLMDRIRETAMVLRLWKVGPKEQNLLQLAHQREPQRSRELSQIRYDRAAHTLTLGAQALVSWEWALFGYLPAFFGALVLVNVQNYYRHYGADPSTRTTDSVSYYGKFYNLIAFNDGYHQEHHLSPALHWSKLPALHERRRSELDSRARVVSPLPAIIGFLHRDRPLLHRETGSHDGAAQCAPHHRYMSVSRTRPRGLRMR